MVAFLGVVLLLGVVATPVEITGAESLPRPTPAWVRMIDLGDQDPALRGYRAPAGVKVEVVAREPDVVNPVGMRFLDDGRLLILEWLPGTSPPAQVDVELTFKDGSRRVSSQWQKEAHDRLRVLAPDAQGFFRKAQVLASDLRLPSSVAVFDNHYYLTTRGSVVRMPAPTGSNALDAGQRIVQGLASFNQHQASGLTFTPDGWLMVTSGDEDSHAEGTDGTRVNLLRTGAVWRMRPDGRELSVFARGFRNPYRDVVLDDFANIFHADNDNEDGSKFQGCRLLHVLEEADYGWRLRPGVRCCFPDHHRGAVAGELPGRMPIMAKTGRGAPAGLMLYQGTGFPSFFRGLLVYPDVFQRNVRAYRVGRDGSTFKVVEQFDLLTSSDGDFRPSQALTGPDGAIYLADWRTGSAGPGAAWGNGKTGRIWRLSWTGGAGLPETRAIARGPLDAWSRGRRAGDGELIRGLSTLDFELRMRLLDELVQRGRRELLVAAAGDSAGAATARGAALMGASRLWDPSVETAMLGLLGDPHFELRRLAADALAAHATPAVAKGPALAALRLGLGERHPAALRAIALAYARVALDLPVADPARARVARDLYAALRADSGGDRFLHDGLLRALERLGPRALRLLGHAAISERSTERTFAIGEIEALRTRDAGPVLDEILRRQSSLERRRRLGDPELARLLTTYRYLQAEPPIEIGPLSRWLQTSEKAPAEAQAAALLSLTLLGQADASRILPTVMRLLSRGGPRTRATAIVAIGEQRLLAAASVLVEVLRDSRRSLDERRTALGALAQLRPARNFTRVDTDAGVDAHVETLAKSVSDPTLAPLRMQLLALVAQIDFKQAQPLAMQVLEGQGPIEEKAAAVAILASNAVATKGIAERFVAGALSAELLPQVAAALQRHMKAGDPLGVADLRQEILKRGFSLTEDSAAVERMERLIKTRGNPLRGMAIFLDPGKAGCISCHRLEGVGAAVGPDLTDIHRNSTAAKVIESIMKPSQEIKEGYETFSVVSRDGQIYEGFKISVDSVRTVLRDATGKDLTIPTVDIREMKPSGISLMPEGLAAGLSVDEFVDLVAFLTSPTAQAKLRNSNTR